MKINYEVTIGFPVYNVEKYLRKTMESALSQTFENIEYLICDDCGTDSSISILEEYQQNHPRGKDIHIVHQPHNMGQGAARNRIIAEAQGRYIYFMDADDIILPHTIELLYETAQKYQAEMVYGSYERVFLTDNNRIEQYPYPFKVFTKPDEFAVYAYRSGVQIMHWNVLTDIDVYRRNHLKVTPVGSGYGEDFTFTVDLPTYVQRVVLLPDITYQYLIIEMEEKIRLKKRMRKLSRKYMDFAIEAIDQKKQRKELCQKPYYAERCAILMMYDYSFACRILAHRADPAPRYSDKEIRNIMRHPMSLREILRSKRARLKNLQSWIFGVLPPLLSVALLKFVGKLTHRI